MIAEELINPLIPPLKTSDSTEKAILWMEELRLHQLPVVEEGVFHGMVSDEYLYDSNQPKQLIGDYDTIADQARVHYSQHFFDIIRLAQDNEVGLVAVTDDQNKYRGVVTLEDTLSSFAKTTAVQSPGGILVLAMNQVDYSLAEISRLIEADEMKILSVHLEADPTDPTRIRVTIKVNKMDLSRVIATLERFSYTIIAQFHEPSQEDHHQERLEALFRYLDI